MIASKSLVVPCLPNLSKNDEIRESEGTSPKFEIMLLIFSIFSVLFTEIFPVLTSCI